MLCFLNDVIRGGLFLRIVFLPQLLRTCTQLGAVLDTIEVKKPRIPVVSNVDAAPHSDPAVIKDILKKQVCTSADEGGRSAQYFVGSYRVIPKAPTFFSRYDVMRSSKSSHFYARSPFEQTFCLVGQVTNPVQFEQSLANVMEKGFENGYECGPGKVVAGILKRVDKKAQMTNVEV